MRAYLIFANACVNHYPQGHIVKDLWEQFLKTKKYLQMAGSPPLPTSPPRAGKGVLPLLVVVELRSPSRGYPCAQGRGPMGLGEGSPKTSKGWVLLGPQGRTPAGPPRVGSRQDPPK